MGHMLRKTAVIAVLILVVSSFAMGSAVRVPADAGAGSGHDRIERLINEGGRADHLPGAGLAVAGHAQTVTGIIGQGYVQQVPDKDSALLSTATFVAAGLEPVMPGFGGVEAFAVPVIGFSGAGLAISTPDAIVSEGQVEEVREIGYTTMIIYLNDTRVERPASPAFSIAALEDGQHAGMSGGMLIRAIHMPDDLILKTRMAVHKPGTQAEYGDLIWEKRHPAGPEEHGSFTVFSGHVIIPGPNDRSGKALPYGAVYSPEAGDIVIDGEMVVNMAALHTVRAAEQAKDTYDNQISPGETKWHSASVGDAVESVNFDVKWADPDSKIRLMIYTPDGKVLGPYYDDSDGKTDGRINLNVANPMGVAAGEWHLKVTSEDTDLLRSDYYYVKTY